MRSYIQSKKMTEVFLNLVSIAAADSIMSKEEFAYLVEFGNQCGFTELEVSSLLKSDDVDFMVPASHSDQLFFLSAYFKMAFIDGVMDEREESICKDLCRRMSISDAEYAQLRLQMENAYHKNLLKARRVA
jgi:hypothetical protein